MVVLRRVSEEKGVLLNGRFEDSSASLVRESLHERDTVQVDKFVDGIGSGGSQDTQLVPLVVESLDDDSRVVFDTKSSFDLGGGGDGEGESVVARGSVGESLGARRVGISEVSNNECIVTFLHVLKLLGGGDGGGDRASLLLQPGDDLIGLAASTELGGDTRSEKLESRETLHIILGTSVLVLRGINLGQLDLRLGFRERGGGLDILGGEGLAMSAPRSVKLDENKFVGFDGLSKKERRE